MPRRKYFLLYDLYKSRGVSNMFLGKSNNNLLPTKDNFLKILCLICVLDVETTNHILWKCFLARDV